MSGSWACPDPAGLRGGVWPRRAARRAWPYKPGRTLPCQAERLASDGRNRNGSGVEVVAPCVVYIRNGREEKKEKKLPKVVGCGGGEQAYIP